MNRQKSFQTTRAALYLVATPIGNLQEMTPRAIEVLKQVSVIACEDTRITGNLLHHFGIETRLIQHHKFNEKASAQGIIDFLERGYNVAIVSDAGYPLVSDPGQLLVQMAVEKDYPVIPISGCSAMLNALVASGCVVQPFAFIGFLPPNTSGREKALLEYKNLTMTLVFYEAPHRIEKMLESILQVLGDRQIVLARELTKKHEEFIRGKCSEVLSEIEEIKGEFVVVVEGFNKKDSQPIDFAELSLQVEQSIRAGMSRSQAIKEVAKLSGVSKNELYKQLHVSQEEMDA
ncbi:MAG: 16S rRNA (cytidine(1402)-2'-O)-methyltransferase [Anaerorhabdus sp.]